MTEWKVNIIFSHNNYGLSKDAQLLVKYLDQILTLEKGISFKVRAVNTNSYTTGYVDINIFLEVPNPLLFHFAKVNILVPNQEWYYQHWHCYLPDLDFIWCKTEYAFQQLQPYLSNDKLIKIGWISNDKWSSSQVKKEEFVHIAGSSPYKGTQQLIEEWKSHFPPITIYYNSQKLKLQEKIANNIFYIRTHLSNEEMDKVIQGCRFHLCPSQCEGYGHYIMEALSCKNLVITLDKEPMRKWVSSSLLLDKGKEEDLVNILDTKTFFHPPSLEKVLDKVSQMTKVEKDKIGDENRQIYLQSMKSFRTNLKEATTKVGKVLRDKTYREKIPLEIQSNSNDLPKVSIVTLTHNRKEFLELMKMNYLGIDYPREHLEWIIVDDSDKSLDKDELENIDNLTYLYLEKQLSIGEKRNKGVEKANHSLIAFMDDDDIYYPRNLLLRVSYLHYYQKQCVGCTTIGNFDINRLISHINVPPLTYPFEKRVAEASLLFSKDFWLARPFTPTNNNEGADFLRGRYKEFVEMNWNMIMVSLTHHKNISNRNQCLREMEPNGCHFGLSDDLFKYLIELQKYNIEY